MPQILERALENKKGPKKGKKPNYADLHGDRHQKAKLHGLSPKRQEVLGKKMSLDQMHSHKGYETYSRLNPEAKSDFAKRDRDQSRAAMIKKMEAAGDYESARVLKGQ